LFDVISIFWCFTCFVYILYRLVDFTYCHSYALSVVASSSSSLVGDILYRYGFCWICYCGCCRSPVVVEHSG
jgi:hypothetical protein